MTRRLPGIALATVGLLMVLTPWAIFPICGQGRYAPPPGTPARPHKCLGTAHAATALGAGIILAGAIAAARPRRRTVRLAAGATALLSLAGAAAPRFAGICLMATMPCRAGTVPALDFLAFLGLATAAAAALASRGWE